MTRATLANHRRAALTRAASTNHGRAALTRATLANHGRATARPDRASACAHHASRSRFARGLLAPLIATAGLSQRSYDQHRDECG